MSDDTREPGMPGEGNAANRVVTAKCGKAEYTLAEAATVLRCPPKWLSNHCSTGKVACEVRQEGDVKRRYILRDEVARLAAEQPWTKAQRHAAAWHVTKAPDDKGAVVLNRHKIRKTQRTPPTVEMPGKGLDGPPTDPPSLPPFDAAAGKVERTSQPVAVVDMVTIGRLALGDMVMVSGVALVPSDQFRDTAQKVIGDVIRRAISAAMGAL